MMKKFWEFFDLRSDNKWLNILTGGIVSFIIGWSAAGLLFEENERAWTVVLFLVFWGFLIWGEFSTEKAKKDGVVKGDKKK